MRHFHCFGGHVLTSNTAIPELPVSAPAGAFADITVQIEAPGSEPQVAPGTEFSPWHDDDERVYQAMVPGGLIVSLTGTADYLVRQAPPSVACYPARDSEATAVRHFLLNQILPRLLGTLGALVLHGSAIRLGSTALGFIGGSGAGKSTLAASLVCADQATLLADDGIIVSPTERPPRIEGTYGRSRLWPDSAKALGARATANESGRGIGYKQVINRQPQRSAPSVASPLRALFILESPGLPQDLIQIVDLRGAAAIAALIAHSFLFREMDRTALARQFEAAAALVLSGVHIRTLAYPRRFQALPELRAAIIASTNLQAH